MPTVGDPFPALQLSESSNLEVKKLCGSNIPLKLILPNTCSDLSSEYLVPVWSLVWAVQIDSLTRILSHILR
jgi:hypothetical protein